MQGVQKKLSLPKKNLFSGMNKKAMKKAWHYYIVTINGFSKKSLLMPESFNFYPSYVFYIKHLIY